MSTTPTPAPEPTPTPTLRQRVVKATKKVVRVITFGYWGGV